MDFLRACAARLDAGEDAASVLADMRARYTTVRCLSTKTCAVRQLCAPTAEYAAALARGEPRLPPRLPANARALRLTREEVRECKRLARRGEIEKNRTRTRVDGRALLAAARGVLRRPPPTGWADLALALLLCTGRRTCEVLNGRSRLEAEEAYAMHFVGQAKKRTTRRAAAAAVDDPGEVEEDEDEDAATADTVSVADDPVDEEAEGEGAAQKEEAGYRIPVLAPAADVTRAFAELRRRQQGRARTNAETSRRYQSQLSAHLKAAGAPWAAVAHVHGLRGVYACMALRLFDFGEASDAFATMSILGHAGLHESLVYTPFGLGDDFGDEPRLGRFALPPPLEEVDTAP
jgi:integrase